MGKLTFTVTCPEQDGNQYNDIATIYHIPDEPGCDTTLCGLSDVPYIEHDIDYHPVNCRACIGIVKYCKYLKFKRDKE